MGFEFGMYFPNAGNTYVAAGYPYYGNVQCNGDEETIWDCSMDTFVAGCNNVADSVFLYCVQFS